VQTAFRVNGSQDRDATVRLLRRPDLRRQPVAASEQELPVGRRPLGQRAAEHGLPVFGQHRA